MSQSVSIAELMKTSGVSFGTSGARGTVAAMTDRTCWCYTTAFIEMLRRRGQAPQAMAIAGDLRPSTGRILAATAHALRSAGVAVRHCGRIPSPAVALYGIEHGLPTLMVTGSHIPDDRNGIKFTTAQGEITKEDEQAIREEWVDVPEATFGEDGMLLEPESMPEVEDAAAREYVARYLRWFGKESLRGLRVGLYEHSSVGRDLAAEVLRGLGAEVVGLGRSEVFLPVDTEAIRPEDVKAAAEWAKEGPFDALVSMDGDADRPLLSDAQGVWLRGDVLGILVSRILGVRRLAIPVSCNTAADKCGSFDRVQRTRIGSPFVIAAMQQLAADAGGAVAGYEANGGYLLQSPVLREGRELSALPTRDALLPVLAVLEEVRRSGRSVAALCAELPQRFTASDRLKEFPTDLGAARVKQLGEGDVAAVAGRFAALMGSGLGAVVAVDRTDGLRLVLSSEEVVHLRPSGNAPELRCYAEAQSAARAAELVGLVLGRVASDWR